MADNAESRSDKDKKESNNEQKEQKKVEIDENEYNKLIDECKRLKENLIRLAAEFDNFKKRAEENYKNAERTATVKFFTDMLPILDEFDIAMIALKTMADNEIVKGIAMVYSNLYDYLKKMGLREIEAKGRYDPNFHEVILSKDSDKPEGEILEIIKKGYIYDNIVIRPSLVIISNGNAKRGDGNE
ncbi:MAG: protein GrpE [Candidatus Micrarchaeota archaeon]|nr:MAG: protein GrpE [Candidatus Micrarchaeota archaeon]